MNMKKTRFIEKLDDALLIVERTFDGPTDLVWRTWTEADLLDQWWAPLPWKAVTKHMDFREGGYWHYCMQGPEGQKHWGKANYLEIVVEEFFRAEDVFCDEEGHENTDLPGSRWHVLFTGTATTTTVKVTTAFDSKEAMKQLIAMGVKEGSSMAHRNLDQLLEELKAA